MTSPLAWTLLTELYYISKILLLQTQINKHLKVTSNSDLCLEYVALGHEFRCSTGRQYRLQEYGKFRGITITVLVPKLRLVPVND